MSETNNKTRVRRPAGRGPGRRVRGEKAQDFTGTWKKLLAYCQRDAVLLIVALLCIVVATVCTLIGPNKLGDLTDEITAGIRPDTKVLTTVSKKMTTGMTTNIQSVTADITVNMSNTAAIQQNTKAAMASPDVPAADKQALQAMAASGSRDFSGLSDGTLDKLFGAIEINGTTLTGSDQVKTLQALQQMKGASSQSGSGKKSAAKQMKSAGKFVKALPDASAKVIFTPFKVKGTTISSADQVKMLKVMSKIDMHDTDSVMDQLDKLPASIYGLIKPSVNFAKVGSIARFIVILYAASFVMQAIQGWSLASVAQRLSRKMRTDVDEKINRLPMAWYNGHSTGDVMSVVTNDVDLIGQSMNQSLGTFVQAVVLFIGSFIMMLITDVRMTLAAVAACLIGFVLMFTIMRHSQKYFIKQQQDLGALDGYIEENYAGHTVIKAYNGEAKAESEFDTLNKSLRRSGFRAQCLSGLMQPIMAFIGNFGYVVVCIVGGVLAINGDIEFGVIVSFMLYVRYFTQPLGQIAQAMQMLQSAAAAGERVFRFLDETEMPDESAKPAVIEDVKGTVDFDHVRFRYDGADEDVIHDFSAHVKPGQKIAIVGPTGAGKTTMVNLLMRFYDLDGGEIRIDGEPTQNLKREAVHAQFCMVLQDTWLFEGTVRENLVYNTPDVSQDKIDAACRAVGLDHFVRSLPQGYDTVLDDKTGLSQGQRQQLTIARAMIADKPMLILDEATSSVDTRTELKIQNAMDMLMSDRTSFVIAHRLSTIRDADLILVMNHGDIIESGTHDELLAQGGFYANLYNSQFESAS
jgi:ABC-type multidrug transport system fused ATPase/permease subunit